MMHPDASWAQDPYFEEPTTLSVDGGTTSAGPLWHEAPTRWGHSMHAMCSYHGMFPARLVHYFLQTYTDPGDKVCDPFSGRGTVALQALIEGRVSLCNDLNPLAYVLTSAKCNPPSYEDTVRRIDHLEESYGTSSRPNWDVPDDIQMLFAPETLSQICFIRDILLREARSGWTPLNAMIAGALAGILHGSFRRDGTSQYLSISMPNTFSMSPAYVKKFIAERGLLPPEQNVFERLRDKVCRLYVDAIQGTPGQASQSDAIAFLGGTRSSFGNVDLLLTSPPYLQVVNYGTANWIRLWLLGVEDVGRERGKGRRSLDLALDHRHTYATYEIFFQRLLSGVERSLKEDGIAAIVIGDVAGPGKTPVPLAREMWSRVGGSSGLSLIDVIEDDIAPEKKVSRIWGETKGQATDRDCILLLGKKGEARKPRRQVNWDEPYRDAGPDAAYLRFQHLQRAR